MALDVLLFIFITIVSFFSDKECYFSRIGKLNTISLPHKIESAVCWNNIIFFSCDSGKLFLTDANNTNLASVEREDLNSHIIKFDSTECHQFNLIGLSGNYY